MDGTSGEDGADADSMRRDLGAARRLVEDVRERLEAMRTAGADLESRDARLMAEEGEDLLRGAEAVMAHVHLLREMPPAPAVRLGWQAVAGDAAPRAAERVPGMVLRVTVQASGGRGSPARAAAYPALADDTGAPRQVRGFRAARPAGDSAPGLEALSCLVLSAEDEDGPGRVPLRCRPEYLGGHGTVGLDRAAIMHQALRALTAEMARLAGERAWSANGAPDYPEYLAMATPMIGIVLERPFAVRVRGGPGPR